FAIISKEIFLKQWNDVSVKGIHDGLFIFIEEISMPDGMVAVDETFNSGVDGFENFPSLNAVDGILKSFQVVARRHFFKRKSSSQGGIDGFHAAVGRIHGSDDV